MCQVEAQPVSGWGARRKEAFLGVCSRSRQHILWQQEGGKAAPVRDGVGSGWVEGVNTCGEADLGLRAKNEDLSRPGDKYRESASREGS